MTARALARDAALATRLGGTPLALMLDVDGTLAPIAERPEAAVVPAETQRAVAQLAARDGVHVALVSGRAAHDARRMVGVANVWVIGNHGIEVVSPGGDVVADPQAAPFEPRMAHVAQRLRQLVAPVPGVIVEDKRWTLSIHYRLADQQIVPRLRGTIEELARQQGLRMTGGKMLFEVRPPVRVDKGTAVLALAQRLGALDEGASLLFAGDDRTDEDAFHALRSRSPHAVTVRVIGEAEEATTAAELALRDPGEVRELLEWLAALRG